MSEIDVFRHTCLGMIRCGEDYWIPIYRLDEDAQRFLAKSGDILVGGGGGETAALRISMPETLRWSTDESYNEDGSLVETFWSSTDCYEFGVGYASEGWNARRGHGNMEWFIVNHVLAFLLNNYAEYQKVAGGVPLDRDGGICRLPTDAERVIGAGIRPQE